MNTGWSVESHVLRYVLILACCWLLLKRQRNVWNSTRHVSVRLEKQSHMSVSGDTLIWNDVSRDYCALHRDPYPFRSDKGVGVGRLTGDSHSQMLSDGLANRHEFCQVWGCNSLHPFLCLETYMVSYIILALSLTASCSALRCPCIWLCALMHAFKPTSQYPLWFLEFCAVGKYVQI